VSITEQRTIKVTEQTLCFSLFNLINCYSDIFKIKPQSWKSTDGPVLPATANTVLYCVLHHSHCDDIRWLRQENTCMCHMGHIPRYLSVFFLSQCTFNLMCDFCFYCVLLHFIQFYWLLWSVFLFGKNLLTRLWLPDERVHLYLRS